MKMIAYVLFIMAVFIFSILVHEAGHMITYTHITKRKIKLRFNFKRGFVVGTAMDYIGLSKKQYSMIIIIGIFAGIIPLLAFSNWVMFTLGLFVYLVLGCRSDFFNLFSVWRKQ